MDSSRIKNTRGLGINQVPYWNSSGVPRQELRCVGWSFPLVARWLVVVLACLLACFAGRGLAGGWCVCRLGWAGWLAGLGLLKPEWAVGGGKNDDGEGGLLLIRGTVV